MMKQPQGESPCGFSSPWYDCDMAKSRNAAIDIMRTLAIILILSAHCWFPDTYQNIREFDVVMMFFLSGMSFGLSAFEFSKEHYSSYVMRRFRKLILPVWGFLAFFFLLFRLIPVYDFSLGTIVKSFALTAGGIMFVWVYRVFFIAALTTPLFAYVGRRHRFLPVCVVSILLLVINDLLYARVFALLSNETFTDLLSYAINYTIGYGVTVYLGCRFVQASRREQWVFSAVFCALFVLTGIRLGMPMMEAYKFPPHLYYLSYGIAWSAVLYLLLDYIKPRVPLTVWISENCMTIYIAHILVFYLVDPVLTNQWVKFGVLVAGSCIIAWVWTVLKGKLLLRKQ